jgi:hypothetical protein
MSPATHDTFVASQMCHVFASFHRISALFCQGRRVGVIALSLLYLPHLSLAAEMPRIVSELQRFHFFPIALIGLITLISLISLIPLISSSTSTTSSYLVQVPAKSSAFRRSKRSFVHCACSACTRGCRRYEFGVPQIPHGACQIMPSINSLNDFVVRTNVHTSSQQFHSAMRKQHNLRDGTQPEQRLEILRWRMKHDSIQQFV